MESSDPTLMFAISNKHIYSHKHLHLKSRVYVQYNSVDATNNGVVVTYNVTYKGVKVYICATHDTRSHYVTSN